MISLSDPDEHFLKSECDKNEIWATLRSAPLIYSFCRDATRAGPVVVNDCGDDELAAEHGIAQLGVVRLRHRATTRRPGSLFRLARDAKRY